MSEFRQDPVSGDWMIIAPERMKRPDQLLTAKRPKRKPTPKSTCPFENLQKTGNWPPIFQIPQKGDWRVVVLPNKYPALTHANVCAIVLARGPYKVAQGVGHHELVVGRDHEKNLAGMNAKQGLEIMRAIRSRYATLARDKCVKYAIAIFNWGPSAGASQYHPHYQLLALPIIPPQAQNSYETSRKYYEKHRKCVHCAMLDYERKEKTRIIEENRYALAVAPYASINRFEVRIFPKRHEPSFEAASEAELAGVTELLQSVLRRIKKYLYDPDLNFFIHSAPVKDKKRYAGYHWHIEILPKGLIPEPAGFELGTRIDINSADPDKVASILKGRAG